MFATRNGRLARIDRGVAALTVPPAAWKTCPWGPDPRIELGLRQWLRCAGVALVDGEIIGMPSRAVDEVWHGLILCTARYARFCDAAYGRFLHHHPEGDTVAGEVAPATPRRRRPHPPGSMQDQRARTVAAWEQIGRPDETCVLWDLDRVLGLDEPWGVDGDTVAAVHSAVAAVRPR